MSEIRQEVVVTDIRMGFGSMVVFMVKGAIAAIPAVIILWIILVVIGAVTAAVFGIGSGVLGG